MAFETDYSEVDDLCDRIERDDPSVVGETCNIPVFRPHYLRSFVAVLPKSTVVTSLSFDVTAYCHNQFDIQPMLKYLSEAKLIQSVSLSFAEEHSRGPKAFTAGQLIRAVADNAQLALVEFTSRLSLHPRHHLLDLLKFKSSSLMHLTLQRLGTYESTPWSEAYVEAFAATIGSMSVLQSLILEAFPNPKLVLLIVQQLYNHKCLRKLSIRICVGLHDTEYKPYYHGIVMAVASMLRSQVPLEILELKGAAFSSNDMETLVEGLECCLSLVELTLVGGHERASWDRLLGFLRAGRSSAACTIQQLFLQDTSCMQAVKPALSILASDQGPTSTSIGSCLQVLTLPCRFDDIDKLLNNFVTGEHRLSSLSLGYLTDESWSQLTQRLPSLLHLREFHLKTLLKKHASSADFVYAMQRNGSLYQVSEISCYDTQREDRFWHPPSPLFTSAESQQIAIYCRRNQVTRELLQNPYLPSSDARDGNAKTSLSLFPKLFHVVKPAQRMAPTLIFLGVLACSGGNGDCLIGPHGRNKRLGP
jgi:hypothetical protein